MGQSGPGSSQVIIPSIVNSLDIDAVIAVGICFGLDNNNQNLGDIIFSSAIIDYESEKTTEAGTQSRGERIHMQAKIIAFCQIPTRQALPYKVLSGVYISGYKLVNNPEMVSALKNKFPDAKAGDMESYAVLNAARSSDVQMICIKGICDWGYNKDDSSQETAAHNAMNYLFKVLDTISNAQNNTITT
jgi:nucleoside phosphorylase